MTTKNLKSQIIDNINDIANGVRKDSNARLNLVVQLQEAETSKKFDFIIDLNDSDSNKDNYKGDFKTIHQINLIKQSHLKYLRDTFMQNFLGVKWKSTDKDNKAKLDALRDAMASYICLSVNAKSMNKDILIQKNNSYFTGANKSKVFVNGEFVNKYCEALNKDNESEKALNFSELVRVSRAWYKAIGGEGVGKKTPFDSAITRATALIQDDLNAIEPFSLSSAKTKTLITYLVNDANKWLQAHKNNQEALKLKRSA
tara:strand:- start:115 stop:885 length:771 start_codon:yes stop_codon:yes gene_type:complete